MKRIKLLTVLLLSLVTIAGCEKDDSGVDATSGIVGKWYIKKMIEVEYQNGTKTDEETTTTFTTNDYFEFKANGTAVYSEDGGPDPADTDDYTYVVTGNTVKLTLVGSADDIITADIRKLTASELTLFADDTEVYQGTTYRNTSELTMTK